MIMLKAMKRGPYGQMVFKGRVLVKVWSSWKLQSWAWEMGWGFKHLQSLQQSLDWVLSWRACLSEISETFGPTRLKEQCLYLASAPRPPPTPTLLLIKFSSMEKNLNSSWAVFKIRWKVKQAIGVYLGLKTPCPLEDLKELIPSQDNPLKSILHYDVKSKDQCWGV